MKYIYSKNIKIFKRIIFVCIMVFMTFSYNYSQTTISFAGINWYVRSGTGGPGPNNWSDSPSSVWVDGDGRLHLKIRKVNNEWQCAEIYAQQSFGYGEYTFYVASNVENYDKNIVVGLFTYENDSREIDIEFSRWGNSSNVAGWYTVQPPPYNSSNQQSFALNLSGDYSTHKFIWSSSNIFFQSYHGHYPNLPNSSYLIKQWTYSGSNNPPVGNERLHINFWLLNGTPPTNQQDAELIISAVSVPLNPCSISVPSGTTVSSSSGSTNISVTSNGTGTWSASESCSWVSLSPSSGTGNGSVTASYQQNTSSSQRSCTITFNCGSNTDTYTLTQEAPTCSVSVPHGTIVSSDAGFKIIPVTTNCDELTWSASESCSWVSLSPSSGTGNGSVTATYQQNTSSSQRSCTITFFCSSNTDTYTLTQEAPPCSISIIAPNGSTDWQTGTSHNIEWTDNISENVKIELYKGGNLHSTLTTPSTPSDGSWNWSIPSDLTTGTDYKIKITSISNSNCYDYSDNFTISYGDNIEEVMLSKYITKIYPNPAYDKLYVEFTDNINKIEELSLYNTLGQVVYSINSKNIQAKNFVIDLSKYKSGIYYLNIQTKEDGIIRNRIIIVR